MRKKSLVMLFGAACAAVIAMPPAVAAAADAGELFGNYPPPYAKLQPVGAADKPYGTVNFWKTDRLEVPVYSGSGNMLLNPSFEEGFKYYTFPPDIGTYEKGYEEKYSIDRTEYKFGRASLKIKALTLTGIRSFDNLQSFGYPVKAGTAYVLSFYAKASQPNIRLRVGHYSENTNAKEKTPNVSKGEFALTDSWERYVITVKANSTGYSFNLQILDHVEGGAAWVDGLQFEEGDSATEFADRPVSATLVTAAPGNFLTPGQKTDGALLVKTAVPAQSGAVEVVVKDFFYHETSLGKFEFTTDADGVAAIKLPLDDFVAQRTGVFVVRAQTKLADGQTGVEYSRFSVMHNMQGRHRNKNIFAYHQLVIPNQEAGLQRWRDIGLGSVNYFFYNFHNKLLFDLLKQYDIEDTGALMRQHWEKSGPRFTGNTIAIQEHGAADPNPQVLVQGMVEWDSVSPEREQAVQSAAREWARYYHWRKNFAFHQEIENKMMLNGSYDDLARLLIACARGVKEASADNQAYLEGGAANVKMGTSLVDNLLTASEKVAPGFKFDRFAVHAYGHPESEEMEELLKNFLAVLDRHGYGSAPVYINEGGYYAPFSIEDWRLTPYRPFLMDQYHLWGISYDMGWGERVSAALKARAWLLTLKHQDRIKQFNMWRPFIYLDCDLTPLAVQKTVNTLSRLFGNASFKQEVSFAPKSKAYVFEDDDQIPIAAIWGYEDAVETGVKSPPLLSIPLNGGIVSVVDLMENTMPIPATQTSLQLPLTPFPIFLKGHQGGLKKLVDVVESISVEDANYPPIQLTSRLKDRDTLTLRVKNLLSRSFSGDLSVQNGSASATAKHLEIPGLTEITVDVKLRAPVANSRINRDTISWKLNASGGSSYSGVIVEESFGIRKAAAKISLTGDLSEWDGIPYIAMTNLRVRSKEIEKDFRISQGGTSAPAELQARFKTAWDDEYFYLLVDVTDSKLFAGARITNRAEVTDCDVLIAYFDTLCDGKDRNTLRVDSDDYYYAFLPKPEEGKVLVYTQETANQQLGLGVNAVKARTLVTEVKTVFKQTETGYFYEVAFPQWMLLPLQLREGAAFGFGLLVNDKNDEQDAGRSLNLSYPPKSSCWRHANFWPHAILEK
jgi:hypothetical protein